MKLKFLLLLCLFTSFVHAQNSTGGVVHFRYVGPTATFIDQPCGPADIAFATDVLPGSNLFMCPVENQWTQMLSTASSIANWTVVGVGPAANAPSTCTARQDAYITTDTQQILYCFATDVFTALPAQSSCANCAIVNGPNTYVGDYLNDFSTSELGLPRHSTDPATCQPGQLEFNAIGQTVKYCSAPNTWSTLTVGTVITGTATFLPVFTGPTNLGNSAVTDDGVTVRTGENVSLGTNSLMSSYPNSSSGTVAYTLTKLDNSGNAIKILTTDTTAIYGVCVIGCAASGTSATALIAVAGQVQCLFDNQTVVRDFVIASTGVAGDCHDAGSTEPTGVQVVGRVVNLNAGTGTTATIALFSPDTAQAAPPVVTFQVANANPGTVLNSLVKLTGAPSTATVTAITDTSGYIGICSGGCGNSGNATIIQQGYALCVFDGVTTAGDYVQISSTNPGQCHDTGAGYPVPGDVVGRVLTTNGGAGTYGIAVFPPESSNPVTATIAAGTINEVVKYTGANAIGPSGVTIDSSNNVATAGSLNTGTGGADSGSIVFNGHTSGGQGFGVLDVAGSAILYLLPTTPTTGDVLQDSGVVTCPTLPAGAPSVCHQLAWVAASAGSVTSFSAGNLSPLFTTSVATATTTPALTFALTNAAGGTVFGNNTSSSGAPVYTAVPVLGVDNTTAGTLQLANGSANAHTIWSSGATTSNTVAGPATAPVTGDLLSCTTASTTCTLTDSGVLAANVVTAASNFTNGAVVQAAGANKTLASATGHGIALPLVCATSSASGTAETCNTSPTFTPAAGDSIIFQADVANTGAFTLNVNSQGAKGVKKGGTAALIANDILASPFQVILTYDGTNWEMQGQTGNTSSLPSGTADQVLVIPHAGGAGTFGQVDLSQSAAVKNDLPIANGGTGAGTAANALINLFPTATRKGDIIYCSAFSAGACTAWTLLAGNNSGTQVLQEDSSGNASWATPAVGGCTATKYTITQSPFGTTWTVTGQSGQSVTASTTTQTINIVTLASKVAIQWMRFKYTTAWAGTSMTAFTMSVGTNASGGSTTSYMPPFNVFAATSDSPFGATPGYFDEGGLISGADNGETVTLTAISTGGNLTATTAGSADLTLCTVTLP